MSICPEAVLIYVSHQSGGPLADKEAYRIVHCSLGDIYMIVRSLFRRLRDLRLVEEVVHDGAREESVLDNVANILWDKRKRKLLLGSPKRGTLKLEATQPR